MPSPFPGMDQFLEHPDVFPDLHDALITYLREFLQPALPEPYYSAISRRAWIEVSERYVEADLNVVRPARVAPSAAGGGAPGAAVADVVEVKPIVIHVPHDEHREPFLGIYLGRGQERRLVTHLEVLSPSNKTPGTQGRELYLRKQREILGSQVHLVEVDLLRAGTHTTAVPLDQLRREAPEYSYHVCVHRDDRFQDYTVYPIPLAARLPGIDVPLLPDDGSVPLDLQAVFDRCYDAGPYRREIDYLADQPQPPLSAEHASWVQSRLESTRTVREPTP